MLVREDDEFIGLAIEVQYRPFFLFAFDDTVVQGSQLHDLGIKQYDRFPFGLSAVISNLGTGTYQVGLCGFTERGSTTSNAWNYNEGGSTSALVSGEVIDDPR